MLFYKAQPWWSCNSYTLVWPVAIPRNRAVEIVEVCIYIPDFEKGENRFRYNRRVLDKTHHTLTAKQRHNIEQWLCAYRNRIRVRKEIQNAQLTLDALIDEERRLSEFLCI